MNYDEIFKASATDNLPRTEADHDNSRASDIGAVESVPRSGSPEALDADDEETLPRFGVCPRCLNDYLPAWWESRVCPECIGKSTNQGN